MLLLLGNYKKKEQGVKTCIPKGNNAKTLLKNWRPISLLNVDYKSPQQVLQTG